MENIPEELKAIITNITLPSKEDWDKFLCKIEYKTIEKNSVIVSPKIPCDFIFFLAKGYTRHYCITENGDEITTWISKPGDIVTELYGFYTAQNSPYCIQSITEASIYFINKKDLYQLYDESHCWERFGRIVAENSMIKLSDMALLMQGGNAMDKYLYILQNNTELFNSVSLGKIASFLGISQETLSRVRKKITTSN